MFHSFFRRNGLPVDELQENIRLINVGATLIGILCLIASPILVINDAEVLGYALLPITAVYFSIRLLNRIGRYDLARWALFLNFNVGTYFYLNILGHGLGMEYLYIASVLASLFLFQKLHSRILATTFVTAMVVIGDFNLILTLPELPLSEASKFWIRMVTLPGALIIIAASVFATYVRSDVRMKELQETIQIARTDEMTGLGNRFSFKQDKIHNRNVKTEAAALVMLDLDGLKSLNDTLGHRAGDDFLLYFASLLKQTFQESQAYRFGGDEFVLWVQEPADLEARLSQLVEQIKDYKADFKTGVSFGLAYGREADDVDQMIDMADIRMYQQKALHFSSGDAGLAK